MIEQGATTVFKVNVLNGAEDFGVGTPYVYKLALYTATANLGPTTTTYTTTDEIAGTGYVAGGKVITPTVPASQDQTAYISFENVNWTPAGFTARGALIYNSTTNAAVAVLDFGSDKTASNSFTVTFPTATATTAIIRFS